MIDPNDVNAVIKHTVDRAAETIKETVTQGMQDMKSDVRFIQQSSLTIQQDISALKTDMQNLKQDVTSMHSGLQTVVAKVAEIDKELKEATTNVTTIQQTCSDRHACIYGENGLMRQIQDNTNAITALEGWKDDLRFGLKWAIPIVAFVLVLVISALIHKVVAVEDVVTVIQEGVK